MQERLKMLSIILKKLSLRKITIAKNFYILKYIKNK